MREDWNSRAREDASYYVAFGRRDQTADEFFATGQEIVVSLERELARLAPGNPRARRALEIGCGPGRLLLPMSRHFGEIHGVDVSDEMIARARQNLAPVPHAHVHATNGASLAAFADSSFDFVYSYAVFQHIPSRDVVFEYMAETERILKPGGIARFQFNGLPQTARQYDTWSGARISRTEVLDFAGSRGLQVLALEGIDTQYMWSTWRKPPLAPDPSTGPVRIRRVTNAHSSEPVVPRRGRFAALSIWIENLRGDAGLPELEVRVDRAPGVVTYIGPANRTQLRQLTAILPPLAATGLLPVEIVWQGNPLCDPFAIRVTPPGPPIIRVVSVSDGVNLLAGRRIGTGVVKVTLEELERPDEFTASIGGLAVTDVDSFCTDPLPQRYELNFPVPAGVAAGGQWLEMRVGHRRLPPVALEIDPLVP